VNGGFVSNPVKLVLFVLSFFLALTFVRGFSVETPVGEKVILSPTAAVAYPVTISNPSTHSISFSFEALGPFTLDVLDVIEDATVPAQSFKTITLFLRPSADTKAGDSYSSHIRVNGGGSFQDVSLPMVVGDAAPVQRVDGASATGLASFISFSGEGLLNGVLILVTIVLFIALIARIKNRVVG
jgi:hypothetical protein